MATQKLYCYVDETGQDLGSKIFIVSVVILAKDREKLISYCEKVEETSGKGKFKWGKASHTKRIEYLKQIFSNPLFKASLHYSLFDKPVNYDMATILGIAKSIHSKKSYPDHYSASIWVDGLSKNKRHRYGSELRKLGISVSKVQGVIKDENNALTRLSDAIAGFVRDAVSTYKKGEIYDLFMKTKGKKILIEV